MKISSEYTMRPDALKALQDRGHGIVTLNDRYMDFASGQFAWRLEEEGPAGTQLSGYIAASDARKDGHAAGV